MYQRREYDIPLDFIIGGKGSFEVCYLGATVVEKGARNG